MPEPIILGIDPAIATIGFGVIQGDRAIDYGVIKTSAEDPTWKRLQQIEADVLTLCENFKPDQIGIEMPFFGRENTNAGIVQQALGVILLAIGKAHSLDPVRLHQSQVKKTASGSASSSKADMQRAVMQLFSLSAIPKPDDAADGLAIAYAVQSGATSNIK